MRAKIRGSSGEENRRADQGATKCEQINDSRSRLNCSNILRVNSTLTPLTIEFLQKVNT